MACLWLNPLTKYFYYYLYFLIQNKQNSIIYQLTGLTETDTKPYNPVFFRTKQNETKPRQMYSTIQFYKNMYNIKSGINVYLYSCDLTFYRER